MSNGPNAPWNDEMMDRDRSVSLLEPSCAVDAVLIGAVNVGRSEIMGRHGEDVERHAALQSSCGRALACRAGGTFPGHDPNALR